MDKTISFSEKNNIVPVIDKVKTGHQIRRYMNRCGLSVQDVRAYLSLGSVQSVYHWLEGHSIPSLDNLYALSELFQVPMDVLVAGNRSFHPDEGLCPDTRRLLRYYRGICRCI